MELVALLSSGADTWAQVSGLMKYGDWDKVMILGGEDAKTFTHEKNFQFIQIDLSKKLKPLKEEFQEKLKGKFEGMETALSIASGDGKEHMALMSALINLPMGIRFAALTKDGVIDL
jgi:ERCC4-related helicase